MSNCVSAHGVYGVLVDPEASALLDRARADAVLALELLERHNSGDQDPGVAAELDGLAAKYNWGVYLRGPADPDPADEDALFEMMQLAGDMLGVLWWAQNRYNEPGLKLIWTGDADDRLGPDDVEPGRWVLGIGLLSFPRPRGFEVSDEFRLVATWHTWCEGG